MLQGVMEVVKSSNIVFTRACFEPRVDQAHGKVKDTTDRCFVFEKECIYIGKSQRRC